MPASHRAKATPSADPKAAASVCTGGEDGRWTPRETRTDRPTDRPTDRQPKSSGAPPHARRSGRRRTRAPTQPLGDLTRRALQLIRAHACKPGIRLATVAKALGRSESRVSHLVTIETGLTFREHVEAVRLREAKALLRDRDLSVKEVAGRVGWWPAELVRHFERATGMSPGRWRTREWARRPRPRRRGSQPKPEDDSDPDTGSRIRQRIAGTVNPGVLRPAGKGRSFLH